MDDSFNELGTVTLQFKMASSYTHPTTKAVTKMRPEVVDARKNPINPVKTKIWGGTIAKVCFGVRSFGILQGSSGLGRYLMAVQVLQLASSTGGGASAFDVEDGYDSKDGSGSDFDGAPAGGGSSGDAGDDQF